MIRLLKSPLLVKFILRSIVLLFISIACIEYLTYRKTSDIIEKQITEQQQREVVTHASFIERAIEKVAIDTKIIAQLPTIEDMLINTQYGLTAEAERLIPLTQKFLDNQIERNPHYEQFGICDKSGRLIFLYPKNLKPLNTVRCKSQTEVRLLHHGAQSLILSQTTVVRSGKPIGSAYILLNITGNFESIASEHIIDTGFMALFDQNMQLLTRLEPANQAFADSLKRPDYKNRSLSKQAFDGKEALVYALDIKPIGWHLFAVAYTDEMFADLVNILYLISFIVLCVFVIEVVFLSYFTNALVIRPIGELLKATKHILRGNFKHTIEVKSTDEIGKLTRSFNRMTETVDNQMGELRSLNQKLKLIYSIFETGKESIVVADHLWRILDVNKAFVDNFGFYKDELVDKNALQLIDRNQDITETMTALVHRQGHWQGELLLYAKTGKPFAQLCSVYRVVEEQYGTTHHILLFSDISQLKETQKQLEKLAHYDELTGLYNRYQFNISLHLAVEQCHNSGLALFFIDLDNFKYINDTMGHDIGDGFLKEVAVRLKRVTRSSDIVSRFGGDEFVLLLKDLHDQAHITQLADKVRQALNTMFEVNNKEIYASASIGIALFPSDATTPSDLLKAADIAMYSAKDSGKNAYQFFMPDMNKAIREKLNFEERLNQALQLQQFEYYYQPKHCQNDPTRIKAEALIRWRRANGELVGPNEFIAIAEESGLIVPISYHTFEKGCRFLHRLTQAYDRTIEISFNLSGRQFRQHDLAKRLHEIALESQVSPQAIEFEITESVIMADPELAKVICRQIKEFGFRLSLDDFGIGYSSLSYIRDYPIDCIKVDRSFVQNIDSDITNQAIINAVLSIAKSMSLEVICEGVETAQQLAFLSHMGVTQFQGFYFSKPLQHEAFAEYLDEHFGRPSPSEGFNDSQENPFSEDG